jgi:hypothetical protein
LPSHGKPTPTVLVVVGEAVAVVRLARVVRATGKERIAAVGKTVAAVVIADDCLV